MQDYMRESRLCTSCDMATDASAPATVIVRVEDPLPEPATPTNVVDVSLTILEEDETEIRREIKPPVTELKETNKNLPWTTPICGGVYANGTAECDYVDEPIGEIFIRRWNCRCVNKPKAENYELLMQFMVEVKASKIYLSSSSEEWDNFSHK